MYLVANKLAIFDPNKCIIPVVSRCVSISIEFLFVGPNCKTKSARTLQNIRWTFPPHNWYKVNTNDSSIRNPSIVRGGGLTRDDQRKWIKGYIRHLGVASNIYAELWVIRDGLTFALRDFFLIPYKILRIL